MRQSWPTAVLVVALGGVALGAVTAEQEPRHGRLFPPENLGELEGPDRDAWQMPDAVMDALGIADGSRVADIGAGGGWFTVRLARRVGPNGIVYAQDVQPQMLEAIGRRVDREGLTNVRLVRGNEVDPHLAPSSVEVVLIVDAYHEFGGNAPSLLKHLRAALEPGGRLGVIEHPLGSGGPGPPAEDRIPAEQVIAEVEAAGFRLVRRETFLPFQYFLIFERDDSAAPPKTRKAPETR
ncbi:MAG TPA: methyltransferase domain-containing protein [Vicinamibacterales bacterium]|nr:methyltransferase domain-containing protein [Vicinamibacterales bacterium]